MPKPFTKILILGISTQVSMTHYKIKTFIVSVLYDLPVDLCIFTVPNNNVTWSLRNIYSHIYWLSEQLHFAKTQFIPVPALSTALLEYRQSLGRGVMQSLSLQFITTPWWLLVCTAELSLLLCALWDFPFIHDECVDNSFPSLPAAYSFDAAIVIPNAEVRFCAIIHKLTLQEGE